MHVSAILEKHKIQSASVAYADPQESLSHLNGDILAAISQNLAEVRGEKAQKGFVNMVADLYFVEQDLSAHNFVNSIYMLEQKDWSYQSMKSDEQQDADNKEIHTSLRRAIALDFLMDNKNLLDEERNDMFVQHLQGRQYTL